MNKNLITNVWMKRGREMKKMERRLIWHDSGMMAVRWWHDDAERGGSVMEKGDFGDDEVEIW